MEMHAQDHIMLPTQESEAEWLALIESVLHEAGPSFSAGGEHLISSAGGKAADHWPQTTVALGNDGPLLDSPWGSRPSPCGGGPSAVPLPPPTLHPEGFINANPDPNSLDGTWLASGDHHHPTGLGAPAPATHHVTPGAPTQRVATSPFTQMATRTMLAAHPGPGSGSDSQASFTTNFPSALTSTPAWAGATTATANNEIEALLSELEQDEASAHMSNNYCLAKFRMTSDASSLALGLDLPPVQCRMQRQALTPPAPNLPLPKEQLNMTPSSLNWSRSVFSPVPGMPLSDMQSFYQQAQATYVRAPVTNITNSNCSTPSRQETSTPPSSCQPSCSPTPTESKPTNLSTSDIVNLLGLIKPSSRKRSRQDIAAMAAIRHAAGGRNPTHYRSGCYNCGARKTPQWRVGPDGARTLCNACGVRFKKGLPLAYTQGRRSAPATSEQE